MRKEYARVKGHAKRINCLVFSLDGQQLASGSDDKTIALWDAVNGKRLRSLQAHTDSVDCLAFLPGSNGLPSGSSIDDKSIRIWDINTGKETKCLQGHEGRIQVLAAAPNGKLLASGDHAYRATLRLWDLDSGKEVQKLQLGKHAEVGCLAFSPDSRL